MSHSRFAPRQRRECRSRKNVESLGIGVEAVGCDLFEDHLGAHIGLAGKFGIYWETGGESWFTDESGREHALVAVKHKSAAPPVDPDEDRRQEQEAAAVEVQQSRRQQSSKPSSSSQAPAPRPAVTQKPVIY